MENNNEIKLVQSPVITHRLAMVGQGVTERLNALNIENTIATPDTVKSLKELRATLNKELSDFESQRKFLKEGVMNPYNEFESIYKTEISEKYTGAISSLKDKIAIVEDKIKEDKKENVKSYFVELCLSEDIDFVSFPQVGLEINLSTSEKAYKEKCNEFVQKIVNDLALINTQDHKAEIMAEYKKTLNVSKSIKDVQDRKERERMESERIRITEMTRRINAVCNVGLVFDNMTNCFAYNDQIYISQQDIEDLTIAGFSNKLIQIEMAIREAKASIIPTPEVTQTVQAVCEPIQTPVAPPLQAPTVEVKEEILEASFTVSGTFTQLKALGQYMKSIPLTYKNIK